MRFETPTGPGSNFTRPVDIYTKSGDIGLYSAMLALDPDHGFGFSILTAGKKTGHVRDAVGSLLVENFVPALEEAAREEADASYSAHTQLRPMGSMPHSRSPPTIDLG